ncbi:VOC family protein [Paenibacillus sp. NPDC058174]|uniref:VOC family protein n=1 Tax=Paenibacillus sp. NPDC058174 TaxID=3346366 RepID=UPI0036D9894B
MTELSKDGRKNAMRAVCSVYVPVRNPLESAAWWQRHFGLEWAMPYNPEENHAIMKLADGQWLHLVETEGNIDSQFRDKSGYEMFRFTFEVREIEHIYDRLRSGGVDVQELKDRGSCGINFVFYDSDGNKFDVNEVVQAHRSPEEAAAVLNYLFAPANA